MMKNKRYIPFLSIVFTTTLLFITTAEASEKEYELGKNAWKEIWEKLKLDSDNREKIADCIIIGTVKEVKDTPDADFYFHQATISVERWIKGDAIQKEILVKYVYPRRMTMERLVRGRNWENFVRKTYKMEPQQFLHEFEHKKEELLNSITSLSDYFKFTEGEKVLIYLTSLPIEIHCYYDNEYNEELGGYSFLGDHWPYDDAMLGEFLECEGYYEVLWSMKYTIKNDNTVSGTYDGKSEMTSDEFVENIERKLGKRIFDVAFRLGQGGFRDNRAEDGKLGGGQLVLDVKLDKLPIVISIAQEYYKKSPDAIHPYEIEGLFLANLFYTRRLFKKWKSNVFLGGGAGIVYVPKGETEPDVNERGIMYDLEGGINIKAFWKIGIYGVGKYIYSKKTKNNVNVIDFSNAAVLLGISFNLAW